MDRRKFLKSVMGGAAAVLSMNSIVEPAAKKPQVTSKVKDKGIVAKPVQMDPKDLIGLSFNPFIGIAMHDAKPGEWVSVCIYGSSVQGKQMNVYSNGEMIHIGDFLYLNK